MNQLFYNILPMEITTKIPKKSELTGHSLLNKIMMYARATEFDRANFKAGYAIKNIEND